MISIETGHGGDPRSELLNRLKREIKERFSESEHPYHNYSHALDVDVISLKIFDVIQNVDPSLITEADELAREVVPYSHDIIINYDVPQDGPMAGLRERERGFFSEDLSEKHKAKGVMGNERASLKMVTALIRRVDPNGAVFKQNVISEIKEATAATFPKPEFAKIPEEEWEKMSPELKSYFDEEGKGLRIYQPHLEKESGVVSFAIALADLSSGGIVSSEASMERGDAEYRETRQWIADKMKEGVLNISNEEKKRMIDDMRKWMKMQVQFFTWRKIETVRIIKEHHFNTTKENADKIKDALVVPMSERFDELISKSINRSKRFETPEYEGTSLVAVDLNKQLATLLREFGYFDEN